LSARTYGITPEELEKRLEASQTSRRRLVLEEQISGKKVWRNEPCPCESGKKFKKCCLSLQQEARQSLPRDQMADIEAATRARGKRREEVKRGFDLFFLQDFAKARLTAMDRVDGVFPELFPRGDDA
jgi:hypothetical protein